MTTQTMTRDQLRDAVCAATADTISVRERDGEIRVNYRGGDEDTAYYTNDRADALATAKRMVKGPYDARVAAKLDVGNRLLVNWSNGNGYSVYEVRDGAGPHQFELIGHFEWNNDGSVSPIERARPPMDWSEAHERAELEREHNRSIKE